MKMTAAIFLQIVIQNLRVSCPPREGVHFEMIRVYGAEDTLSERSSFLKELDHFRRVKVLTKGGANG